MGNFKYKKLLSEMFDVLQLNKIMLGHINHKYKNNYIRVINYHGTPPESAGTFEKQLIWARSRFQNVDMNKLEAFLAGRFTFTDRPGIMFTFDDGFDNNYTVAREYLEKYDFTGWFLVSSDLVGNNGYMSWKDLGGLIESKHVVGCHTATHHRMNESDPEEILCYEILTSKLAIENELKTKVDLFCWCGGEENHYTRSAAEIIKRGYRFAFMTNSYPITLQTNPLQIERTNVEAGWTTALMAFSVSGWMDLKYSRKRKRIEKLTDI